MAHIAEAGRAVRQVRRRFTPHLHRSSGSNRVGLVVELPDLALVQRVLEGEEMPAAMHHDGVRPETLIILEEAGL